MEEEKKAKGRIAIQKMKPYLVYDYLMHKTDMNHVAKKDEKIKTCGEEFTDF